MSTLASDPLVTSAETWREPGHRRAGDPRRAGAAARGVGPPRAASRPCTAATCCVSERAQDDVRRVAQPRARLAGRRQPRRAGVLPRAPARAEDRGLLAGRPQRAGRRRRARHPAAAGQPGRPHRRRRRPSRPRSAQLDRLALVIVGVVCAQALLTFLAQRISTIFGQDLLSSAREYIVATVLRLPLGRVEGASTGDLVTRVTRDVGTMSRSVQFGLPQAIISGLTVALSVVAMLLNSVLLAIPCLLLIGASGVPGAPLPAARAEGLHHRGRDVLPDQHDADRDRRGRPHGRGARRCSDLRVEAGDDDIAVSAQAERYTMTLRNLLFCVIDIASTARAWSTLLVGAWGYSPRLGLARPDHRGAAVRRVAERAARPARRRDGPAPGRGRVDQPAARHRRGARGPRRRGPTSRRAAPGRRGPPVRLPRGARRTPRGVARPRRRRAAGDRRAVRDRASRRSGRLLSGINGPRTGSVKVGGVDLVDAAAGGAAHRGRAGHPGAPRVRRHGPRQHRAGARGLLRRRRVGRAVGRGLARLGRAAAGRAGHGDRVGQPVADARPRRSRSRWPG